MSAGRTVDASVLVAAFGTWHERHDEAVAATRGVSTLVAHAELETYSVLTRLPAPFRAAPRVVVDSLSENYPGDRLVLSAAKRRRLVRELAEGGVTGGKVYDALIGLTARAHGLELVTCDRRAAIAYERLGIGATPL